ncbi:MAG: hypothetical protein ACR2OE_06135 [Thermomicrobiales bacterium]
MNTRNARRSLLALFLIVTLALIASPVAADAATSKPVTHTYTNTGTGQVLVSVTMEAGTKDDAAAMLKLADQAWINKLFGGMTVTDTMPLDPAIVQAWKATGGTVFEGTFDSRPGTDLCTACDTMMVLVQRDKTITLTIFISTTGPLVADDVQGFADYTGKVVTTDHGTAKPPDGFEEIPTD